MTIIMLLLFLLIAQLLAVTAVYREVSTKVAGLMGSAPVVQFGLARVAC